MVIFQDSIFYYNGNLDTVNYKTIALEENEIKKIIEGNKKEFGEALEIQLKITDKAHYPEPTEKIVNMIKASNVKAKWEPLSAIDKQIFSADDFKREPPEPIEITTPNSITTKRQKLPRENELM